MKPTKTYLLICILLTVLTSTLFFRCGSSKSASTSTISGSTTSGKF